MVVAYRPHHHPEPAYLLDYSTATASLPEATAIALHLEFCTQCQQSVRDLCVLGGALLETTEPEKISDSGSIARSRILEDGDIGLDVGLTEKPDSTARAELPPMLTSVLRGQTGLLDWSWKAPSVEAIPVFNSAQPGTQGLSGELLRIKAGRPVPAHRHHGDELTVVLQGGYRDASGNFGPGDLAFADTSIQHQPIADLDGDCICYVAYGAGVSLTGPVGRWFNWIIRS